MRLIDADKLLKDMKFSCKRNCRDCHNATFLSSDEHCGLIDEQPTAYDVDKVVEELEELEKEHPYKVIGQPDTYSQYNEGWGDCADRAVDIVKGGWNK